MPRFHALIPAAGTGTRVGGDTPKQYLRLAGKPMLSHSIDALLAEPRIASVLVVVSATDARWQQLVPDGSRASGTPSDAASDGTSSRVEFLVAGGATRFDTVRNGVEVLAARAADDDWLLVHDAARPCLSAFELATLIESLKDDDVGGLLALPLTDTVKRESAGRVEQTVSRNGLWRALTPQMFRLSVMRRACAAVAAQSDGGNAPTDEAMAIERLGLQPRLVAGSPANIKVTHETDLALAEAILRARRQGRGPA